MLCHCEKCTFIVDLKNCVHSAPICDSQRVAVGHAIVFHQLLLDTSAGRLCVIYEWNEREVFSRKAVSFPLLRILDPTIQSCAGLVIVRSCLRGFLNQELSMLPSPKHPQTDSRGL